MKIEHIQYIVEIAKTGSISVAAKNMHISQAGISKALANIEKEYNVKLFHRNKNGTMPTNEGNRIIETAADLLVKFKDLENELKNENVDNRTTLKISATADFFVSILSDALVLFKKRFPNVELTLTQKDAEEVVKDVNEGKIDLGFASLYEEIIRENALTFKILSEGNLHALVSQNSHLASYKTITPLELINETIALYDGANMIRLINNFTEQYGPLNILVTTNNSEVIKKVIADNHAIGFSPDISILTVPHLYSESIISIPVISPFNIPRYFGIISLKEKNISTPALNFIEIVKERICIKQI